MTESIETLRPFLNGFNFTGLFVEGLGWNHYESDSVFVTVDENQYDLRPVAEKGGFGVYECCPCSGGEIPLYPVRRKIERQVAKWAFEHLIVFVNEERTRQIWQSVHRQGDQPVRCREQGVPRWPAR